MPTDVLPSNSLHGCRYCEDVLCLEGFSVRSPGSWQGGSWVSALLSGVIAGHLRKILRFLLVFCVCFYARSQFRGICHPIGVVWSGPSSLFCCWLLLFGVFVWFLLYCFLLSVSFGPDLTLDYVMVLTPLLTPQCGT